MQVEAAEQAKHESANQEHAPSPDYGQVLWETDIKRGLRELCPGLHFDMLTKIGQWHPYQKDRQGVFYQGQHICSMDRGAIPEFKVWSVTDGVYEIPMKDIDRYDATKVIYVEILKTDPFYHQALLRAQKKDDNFTLDDRGKVFKHQALAVGKVRDRVIRCGWRHTFERLIQARLPNISRQSLSSKFNVDMNKYPVGTPEEVDAAIRDE